MIKITQAAPEDFPCTDVLFQTTFWAKIKEECSGQVPYYFWITAQFESDDSENSAAQYNFPLLVMIAALAVVLCMPMRSVLRL